MQIEIDIERLISRSVIDGILNPNNLQEEIDNILRGDECQKILTVHVKARLNEIISSEEGKKQIDNSIIDDIVNSEKVQNGIEEILEGDEYQKILAQHIKTCLHEAISSEEGKKQIFSKIKEYLENYDIECDDDFSNELSKGVSDLLLTMMKDSFERLKTSNRQ
jgi:tRNA nucleotidyltransferase/poly(A) polymerase